MILVLLVVWAIPPAATTTGTLTLHPGEQTFNIETTVTMNADREWLVRYSVDLTPVLTGLRRLMKEEPRYAVGGVDQADPPFEFITAAVHVNNCAGLPQSAIPGVRGYIPFSAWSQTLRVPPGTKMCLVVYSAKRGAPFNNAPITYAWFQTPPDPNPPPPPPWSPNPHNTGCGTETTLSLVKQCFDCKYRQTNKRGMIYLITHRTISSGYK